MLRDKEKTQGTINGKVERESALPRERTRSYSLKATTGILEL